MDERQLFFKKLLWMTLCPLVTLPNHQRLEASSLIEKLGSKFLEHLQNLKIQISIKTQNQTKY